VLLRQAKWAGRNRAGNCVFDFDLLGSNLGVQPTGGVNAKADQDDANGF